MSVTGKLRFDETKLIRKELLSIFLIANDASDGIFGFLFIISRARSLIESMVAVNSEFVVPGFVSGELFIFAVM